MAAGKTNLLIEQWAAFDQSLSYKNKNKRPIDLTGCTAHMSIRDKSGALLADLTTLNGKIMIDGPAGKIRLLLTADQTGVMNFTKALYDLRIIPPSGLAYRLIQGTVELSPGQARNG